MTPGQPPFKDPPQNKDAPAGQVAQKLRDILQASRFDTQSACAKAIGYSTSNVTDMLSGRRVQGEAFVSQFIDGCVVEPATAQGHKDEIKNILDSEQAGKPVEPQKLVTGEETGRFQWTPRNIVAVVVAAAILAAAIGYAIAFGGETDCGDGISRTSGGECIGVTNGSANITGDAQFGDLFAKIAAENDRVLGAPDGKPVVSIAYTAPFPKEPGTSLGTQLRQEMEGAYISQLQANGRTGSNPLSGPPRVQLLIANLGDAGDQHTLAVADIVGRTNPEQAAPLVGVIGLDQSVPGVKATIRDLGQRRIPMIGGRIVLDNITDNPYRDGFYGVAPSIQSQIRAGSAYLSANETVTRPMIVVDRNPDDLYGTGLALQLRPILYANSKPGPALTDEPYDASLAGLEATFAQMSQSICIKKPDVIYFAGRGTDLPAFIRGLGQRPCQDQFTVFTISDGRILAPAVQEENRANGPRLLSAALQSGISVRVTAQAHPGKWLTPSAQFPQAAHALLSNDCELCFRSLFPGQSLDDGDTIIGYDAMLVAVNAMRRGADQQNPDVTTQTVRQALARITPQVPVYGASGPIGYTDQAGFPTTKPIPITEVTSDGVIIIAPGG